MDKTKIAELQRHIEKELFPILAMDRVRKMPTIIQPLIEIKVDLNTIYDQAGSSILECAISLDKYYCLAYFLDLGLDPFRLDATSIGWSAIHEAMRHSYNSTGYRLMGFVFSDPRFFGFRTRHGITVEDYLSRHTLETQIAFQNVQAIFRDYRSYHDSAETAEEHHDYLIAALYYFLAASQIKTKVADEEDDFYLKRFHLKKVVGDLRKALEHYYPAILEEGKTLGVLDEFDQCLALSAEIIDSVEPDHPERDWEIKLGDREFFDAWRKQLEALQKWCEERRISFSSASSETSGVSAEDAKTSEEPIRDTDDEKASLLDEAGGLRHRFKH